MQDHHTADRVRLRAQCFVARFLIGWARYTYRLALRRLPPAHEYRVFTEGWLAKTEGLYAMTVRPTSEPPAPMSGHLVGGTVAGVLVAFAIIGVFVF